MTYVPLDFKKMANDPEGSKLLKGALSVMTSAWTEDEKEHKVLIQLGFNHVKKHGTIGKPAEKE